VGAAVSVASTVAGVVIDKFGGAIADGAKKVGEGIANAAKKIFSGW
jgi:hypothetical protein